MARLPSAAHRQGQHRPPARTAPGHDQPDRRSRPRARWSLSAERRSPPPPSTGCSTTPPGADQGRLAPARRGPRRQWDGPPEHLTPPTGENWRPPAWKSGGRQPEITRPPNRISRWPLTLPRIRATAGPHPRRILSRVGAADHAMRLCPAPTWGQPRRRRRLDLVYAQIRQWIRSGPPEGPFLGSRRSNGPLPLRRSQRRDVRLPELHRSFSGRTPWGVSAHWPSGLMGQ